MHQADVLQHGSGCQEQLERGREREAGRRLGPGRGRGVRVWMWGWGGTCNIREAGAGPFLIDGLIPGSPLGLGWLLNTRCSSRESGLSPGMCIAIIPQSPSTAQIRDCSLSFLHPSGLHTRSGTNVCWPQALGEAWG